MRRLVVFSTHGTFWQPIARNKLGQKGAATVTVATFSKGWHSIRKGWIWLGHWFNVHTQIYTHAVGGYVDLEIPYTRASERGKLPLGLKNSREQPTRHTAFSALSQLTPVHSWRPALISSGSSSQRM